MPSIVVENLTIDIPVLSIRARSLRTVAVAKARAIGGKIVNGQTTAPDEIRGTSIEGGEKQTLRAGDIVHVPAKTPHQVLLDRGQLVDYLVLKVDSQ